MIDAVISLLEDESSERFLNAKKVTGPAEEVSHFYSGEGRLSKPVSAAPIPRLR
jgi:hypothetical protein